MKVLCNALDPFDYNDDDIFNEAEPPLDLSAGSILGHLCNALSLLPIEKQMLMNVVKTLPPDVQLTKDYVDTVKKLSFEHLVILLTSEGNWKNLAAQFLITFPLFNSPKYLLACLFARYFTNYNSSLANVTSLVELEQTRKRVITFLIMWMSLAPFYFNETLLNAIQLFYNMVSIGHLSEAEKIMITSLSNQMAIMNETVVDDLTSLMLKTTDNKILGPKSTFPILQKTHPQQIALQIALQDSLIFGAISPRDVIACIGGQLTAKNSPSISFLQEHFDTLSHFVAFSVIFEREVKVRATVYSMWVSILFELRKVNDFCGMFSIYGGITHPSVERLKSTIEEAWKTMGPKTKREFETIKNICSFNNNFHGYRQAVLISHPPCVPFFGCFQKDWVYFQEMNEFHTNDNKIDIPTIGKAYELYAAVQKYQKVKYEIREDITIQKILFNISKDLLDSVKLMQISALQETMYNR
ncbi:RasGEF domain containing protein [Trichomonas vaginalis G3]|uniref:RasGEF domain containing protein n=1 Tax=Trichomonas vaginalis (strain ATCC PRA-98 / G3) TaxID=412133 RepID=A2EE64_TRIV3|nr:guanyl-nucleotide exchange factor protein [Trichomonas vaginalis G3]EAY09061.1 RasGEF domain containing protein [Trichomonas vaginalis G3]KAI5503423.1 guanyl-nucleotide exchange factor protein [Trichomonas vaginalis G3]|eukprot:XP_001321284.1 RasGEF domain containing protein [Trichomonas vaginalis G3]